MEGSDPGKRAELRRAHALNPRPGSVRDPAFCAKNAFFDAHDLVQVKYEMLRAVREEGVRVSEAAAAFGFSRPSFYAAKAAFAARGLPGLLPARPGPRRAHKLSAAVLGALEAALAENPALASSDLAQLAAERFGLSVHPRSVERALARQRKGGLPSSS
jgi:transposase